MWHNEAGDVEVDELKLMDVACGLSGIRNWAKQFARLSRHIGKTSGIDKYCARSIY
jgi:hypothetical protein